MRLLVVEDNPADVLLLREALRMAGFEDEPVVVTDGIAALEYLRSTDELPDLVLLDLNLPRMGGREVLAEIKSDSHLRSVRVVILTTSISEPDVSFAYDHHANAYLRKPLGLDQLTDMARDLVAFWQRTEHRPAPAA